MIEIYFTETPKTSWPHGKGILIWRVLVEYEVINSFPRRDHNFKCSYLLSHIVTFKCHIYLFILLLLIACCPFYVGVNLFSFQNIECIKFIKLNHTILIKNLWNSSCIIAFFSAQNCHSFLENWKYVVVSRREFKTVLLAARNFMYVFRNQWKV